MAAAGASMLRLSQRQPTACTECTRRKVRCDKEVPCSRCIRLRKPCVREVVRVTKVVSAQKGELQFLREIYSLMAPRGGPQDVLRAVESRIARLELGQNGDPSSVQSPTTPSAPSLAIRDDRSESNNGDSSLMIIDRGSEVVSESDATHDDSAADMDNNAGILKSVEFLAWGRRSEACYPHRRCNCYMHRSYSEMVSINCDPEWPGRQMSSASADVVAELPSAADARRIVQFHMDHVLWHHSGIYAPRFLEQCETFWQSGLVDHQLWLAVYLAVLSTSLWSILNSTSHQANLGLVIFVDETLVENLFRAMVQVLYAENFLENFSMYSIQAIVISIRVAHSLGFSNTNVAMIGAAVRASHYLGLHKISEGASSSSVKVDALDQKDRWYEAVEREAGKRAWWQLVTQDYLSTPFTETYIINPAQFTTGMPTNCDDHDLVKKGDDMPTINSYVRVMARIASLMPPLLDGLGPSSSRRSLTEVYKHILATDQKLRTLVRSLPSFLLKEPTHDSLETGNGDDSRSWLALGCRSLALTAADKIITIHRPVLLHSFRTSRLSYTRTTCVGAAITILREHERTVENQENAVWTHSAFCVTAAMVLGLELLYRETHTDDKANEYRHMLDKARSRLEGRRGDVIAARGAQLIGAILEAEEEIVVRVMRAARGGSGSADARQREVIEDMIRSQEIMARFLAMGPRLQSPREASSAAVVSPAVSFSDFDEIQQQQLLVDFSLEQDFGAWFDDVFGTMYGDAATF